MKQHSQKIITALLLLGLAAWMGRSVIRNWFPPAMKFQSAGLITIDDQKTISINDFKGNVVVVSCYQTWCIDCARETPVLNQLASNIKSDNFKVIYVSDEEIEKVTAFRQRFDSGNILFTQFGTSLSSIDISVFPTTFLLNKKGKVLMTKLEGYDWLKEEDSIRKLLEE